MKMTPEQFAFWLQGYVELTGGSIPTQEQWDSIVEHLGLLFNKVTKPVVKKEPAKQILTEKETPAADKPKQDVKQPKEDMVDQDFWDKLTKQMEDWDKIKPYTDPVPYQYPPYLPGQPNWPGVTPGDWLDPLGYPRITC
jgi:hypothetical protein